MTSCRQEAFAGAGGVRDIFRTLSEARTLLPFYIFSPKAL